MANFRAFVEKLPEDLRETLRQGEFDKFKRDFKIEKDRLKSFLEGYDPLENNDVEFYSWAKSRGFMRGLPAHRAIAQGAKHFAGSVVEAGKAAAEAYATDLFGTFTLSNFHRDRGKAQATALGLGAAAKQTSEFAILGAGAAQLWDKLTTKIAGAFTDSEGKRLLAEQQNRSEFEFMQFARFADELTNDFVEEANRVAAEIHGVDEEAIAVSPRAAEGFAELLDPTNISAAIAAKMTSQAGVRAALNTVTRPILTGQIRRAKESLESLGAERITLKKQNGLLDEGIAAGRGDTVALKVERKRVMQDLEEAETALATQSERFSTLVQKEANRAQMLLASPLTQKVVGRAVEKSGTVLERTGDIAGRVADLPSKLFKGVADESPKATRLITRASEGLATGLATGFLGTSPIGFAVGAGVALGPTIFKAAGKDINRIGKVFAQGQQNLPFFQALRKAEGVSGFTGVLSSFLDASPVPAIATLAGRSVRGAAGAAPITAGFGFVASGGVNGLEGALTGAGAGGIIGASVGPLGAWRGYQSPLQRKLEVEGTLRSYKDVLAVNPRKLEQFEQLPHDAQTSIAYYVGVHPDVSVEYINEPGGDSAHHIFTGEESIIRINLASKDPLRGVVSHEVGHHISTKGIFPEIRKILLGEPDVGRSGFFTRIVDGQPVRRPDGSYETIDLFRELTQQYKGRLANQGAFGLHADEIVARGESPSRAAAEDQLIAKEVFAEIFADRLLENGGATYARDLKRFGSDRFADKLIDMVGFDFVETTPFLRSLIGKLGVSFDRNAKVTGTHVFSDLPRIPELDTLIRRYNRKIAGQRKPDPFDEKGNITVTPEDYRKSPELLNHLFDGSSSIARDVRTGEVLFMPDGSPQFKTPKELRAEQEAIGRAIMEEIDQSEGLPPDAVQRREERGGKIAYSGRYFSDAVVERLIREQRFNPVQIRHLRALNEALKESPKGVSLVSFYQSAEAKGRRGAKSLSGRWRTDTAYGLKLTQKGNVLMQTVSPETLYENARAKMRTKHYRSLWESVPEVLRDTQAYLSDLAEGRPGSTTVGVEKRNALNLLLGLGVRENRDANPLFETMKPGKSLVTSLRLDRMNRASLIDRQDYVWSSAVYEAAVKNSRPETLLEEVIADPRAERRDVVDAIGLVRTHIRDAQEEGFRRLREVLDIPRFFRIDSEVNEALEKVDDDTRRKAQEIELETQKKVGELLPSSAMDDSSDALIVYNVSHSPTLKTVDPAFQGTGQAGAERNSERFRHGPNWANFYVQSPSSWVEGRFQGGYLYKAEVLKEDLWDMRLGFVEYQDLVDEGYAGAYFFNDSAFSGVEQVILFQEHPASYVGVFQAPPGRHVSGANIENHLARPEVTQTDAFKRWFGDSVVRDEDGTPKLVYHGTRAEENFQEFRPGDIGIHTGTAEQAAARVSPFSAETGKDLFLDEPRFRVGDRVMLPGDRARLIPLYLQLENPIQTEDLGIWSTHALLFTPGQGVSNALPVDVLTRLQEEWRTVDQATGGVEIDTPSVENEFTPLMERIRQAMRESGHDGFQYPNLAEGEGLSYVALDATQLKSPFGDTFDASSADFLARPEVDESKFETLDEFPRERTTGRYVGSPGITTPQGLAALTRRIEKLAKEGEEGRFWYEESSEAILRLTGGDVAEALTIAKLIAVYSPAQKILPNFTSAVKAWMQHRADQPIKAGRFTARDEAAMRVLRGEEWTGLKTNEFFRNLALKIDPSQVQGVTVDTWQMKLYGFPADSPTPQQYQFVEQHVERVAERLGWEKQQAQAAMWIAGKSRWETVWPTYRAKAKKAGDLVRNPDKGILEWVSVDAEKRWREKTYREAMTFKADDLDVSTASFNFADAVRRDLALVSIESRPGKTTGIFPDADKASPEEITEYHAAVMNLLTDGTGRDLVARELGILTDTPINAPGVWFEERNESTAVSVATSKASFPQWKADEVYGRFDAVRVKSGATQTYVSTQTGNTEPLLVNGELNRDVIGVGDEKPWRPGKLDGTIRSRLRAYVATLGLLLKQDAIGFHRPYWVDQSGDQTRAQDANGVELNIGRAMTADEISSVLEALGEPEEGFFAPISGPEGLRLVNFAEGLDNNAFYDQVRGAVKKGLDNQDLDLDLRRFFSDDEFIENDWSQEDSKNGEDYRKWISNEPGGPAVLERIESGFLPAALEGLRKNFSERYGWGDPGFEGQLREQGVRGEERAEE